jgi:hypothetical protein
LQGMWSECLEKEMWSGYLENGNKICWVTKFSRRKGVKILPLLPIE